MQSLRELKRRIVAATETEKMTSTMKLVAAAHLRRAEEAVLGGREYAREIHRSVQRISRHLGTKAPAMWKRSVDIASFDTIVLTSDRGFCGSFNDDVIDFVEKNILEYSEHNLNVTLFIEGQKGLNYFKKTGFNVVEIPTFQNIEEKVRWIVNAVILKYLSGESSGSYICFNKYVSASQRKVTTWDLLPLYTQGKKEEKAVGYKFEPEPDLALDFFAAQMLMSTVRQALFESHAAELSARIIAMTGACKNAEDMISHLTALYNKARQENITSELMDVIFGAEIMR
jgi:F-type H+-transporting ATPase subunit gamma